MKTSRLWAVLPWAALAAAATAAQPSVRCEGCGHGVAYGHKSAYTCEEAFYQNKMWPNQYIAPARRGICQATEAMIANGWRRHNVLGSFFFDPNTGELSEAGRLKVEWIATQAPANRRTIYVERDANQHEHNQRMQAVQELVASLSTTGVDVQETYVRDHGHPASSVDAVFTGFRAAQMIPALPPSTTAGGAVGVTAPTP